MPDPWSSLEVAKLLIGVLTPLSVAILGWLVSRHLKQLELIQWTNQKVIEKRIIVYDSIAPKLNMLLCFFTFVGYWKSVSPADVVNAKRDLDKEVNIYRHVFDENVYSTYQSFIHTLFDTYTGPGHDAKILSMIKGSDGDRTAHCTYQWNEKWSSLFLPDKANSKKEIQAKYLELMSALTNSLGVKRGA